MEENLILEENLIEKNFSDVEEDSVDVKENPVNSEEETTVSSETENNTPVDTETTETIVVDSTLLEYTKMNTVLLSSIFGMLFLFFVCYFSKFILISFSRFVKSLFNSVFSGF